MIDPTEEQKSICGYKAEKGEIVKIKAYAGTGKTSTLSYLAKSIATRNPETRILYLVFNKNMQSDAEGKFPDTTDIMTVHSLAFRYIGQAFDKRLIDNLNARVYENSYDVHKSESFRVSQTISCFMKSVDSEILPKHVRGKSPYLKQLTRDFNGLAPFLQLEMKKRDASAEHEAKNSPSHLNILDMIIQEGKFRVLEKYKEDKRVDKVVREILTIANDYCDELIAERCKLIWKTMTSLFEQDKPIDHNMYLKLFQIHKQKLVQYNVILLDEAQDSDPLTIDIVNNQSHAIRYVVGDEFQQIYEFRGAINALDCFDGKACFYLTETFRYGESIAQVMSGYLEVESDAPLPAIVSRNQTKICNTNSISDFFEFSRFVYIARTQKSLFNLARYLIQNNKTYHFYGGTDKYKFQLLYDMIWLRQRQPEMVVSRMIKMFEGFEDLGSYIQSQHDLDLQSAYDWVVKSNLTIEDLDRVKKLNCYNKDDASVWLITAHQSKGLEFDNVYVSSDMGSWPFIVNSRETRNLTYVACTRAIETLRIPDHVSMSFLEFEGEKRKLKDERFRDIVALLGHQELDC